MDVRERKGWREVTILFQKSSGNDGNVGNGEIR